MVLRAPRVAAAVEPGQFVHLRLGAGTETILRRPFSVHRAHGEHIELLYQVLGAGTLNMAEKRVGDTSMDVIGPLGHGWVVPEGAAHALLVAGGLGAAPLGMLAERLAERGVAVAVAQGAPTAERLVARQLFERVARVVEVATDDGSAGEHGLVTLPVERLLAAEHFDVAYTCGPEAMQRAVAQADWPRRGCPARSRSSGSWRAASARVCRASCQHPRWAEARMRGRARVRCRGGALGCVADTAEALGRPSPWGLRHRHASQRSASGHAILARARLCVGAGGRL